MTTTLTATVHPFVREREKKISLLSSIFDVVVNTSVLSEAVVLMQKNERVARAHAKGRSEVRGGGKKPWRQKGTGRARHGSIRSPIWKGGGVTHGPSKERNYSVKINKKVRKKALTMVLSGKLRDKEMFFVDSLMSQSHKTQVLVEKLSVLVGKGSSILLVPERPSVRLARAASNIPDVSVKEARGVSALDLLSVKYVVMSAAAVKALEKRLA